MEEEQNGQIKRKVDEFLASYMSLLSKELLQEKQEILSLIYGRYKKEWAECLLDDYDLILARKIITLILLNEKPRTEQE